MHGHELRGRLDRHGVRDLSAHVAALRDVSRVSQAPHQHDPSARDAGMIPTGRRRLAREPITGDRRDHDVEGVLRAASEGRGVGERADELDLLEDRTGPPVRDDDGQRALVLRTHVDEVDVEPVDLGGELGQGVELRLALAPVVVRRPVAREVLERRERHALRRVRDGLLLRPPRGLNAPAEIVNRLLGNIDPEWAHRVAAVSLGRFRHDGSPFLVGVAIRLSAAWVAVARRVVDKNRFWVGSHGGRRRAQEGGRRSRHARVWPLRRAVKPEAVQR